MAAADGDREPRTTEPLGSRRDFIEEFVRYAVYPLFQVYGNRCLQLKRSNELFRKISFDLLVVLVIYLFRGFYLEIRTQSRIEYTTVKYTTVTLLVVAAPNILQFHVFFLQR